MINIISHIFICVKRKVQEKHSHFLSYVYRSIGDNIKLYLHSNIEKWRYYHHFQDKIGSEYLLNFSKRDTDSTICIVIYKFNMIESCNMDDEECG